VGIYGIVWIIRKYKRAAEEERSKMTMAPHNPAPEMEVFRRNHFIIQHKLKDFEDTEDIMDRSKNLLCYVKHRHSWKGKPGRGEMRTTDIQLEGADGTMLGEIHEVPVVYFVAVIRKWYIRDAGGLLRGAVREKQKFFGIVDWVLESAEGVIATAKGNRKRHDYEVLTPDKQVIARCHTEAAMSEDSYGVDILRSDFDPFLILSYVVVLDHVKVLTRERGFGYGGP
jgi:uncharacterized protein YxjI